MPHAPLDAHVRLDIHPAHPSAVTATLTGADHRTAQALLASRGFEPLDPHTMVLARIDHEEPYWAAQAAQAMTAEGITTEVTPALREAITEEWTWADHPMPWCSRAEIREVSDQAQKIHDDIRHRRLLIHAHAHDGWTTVAIGTYRDSTTSVHLHGENHLRQITETFDSPARAIAAFEAAYGDAVQPGAAPLTETERQSAHARTTLIPAGTPLTPAAPPIEKVPAHAADPGDHEAMLDAFLTDNNDWEKYRTWDDNTTVATHESLTLRILFDHDAGPQDARWTIAAYETPVSERMWHMTITPATPAPVLNTLLKALAATDVKETALGSPVTDRNVHHATRPLTDAGWTPTVDGRRIRWHTRQGDVGAQFDAFAANNPLTPLNTWTIWAGPGTDHPTWTLHASAYTPTELLTHLTGEIAHGTGTRQAPAVRARRTQQIAGSLPTPPPNAPTRLRR
ncbi:DUF317 domain-containing protein [Streptomyces sp. NPDC002328]|uniref:DUF317 domain-containing protein n=1 Tax=Streptomyces sp. NPDC002328 TaxID=3364642 RepID=UPI0036CCE905